MFRLATTAAEFERLLIRYMAYHLFLADADADAARSAAGRAFARISFREEDEKLTV